MTDRHKGTTITLRLNAEDLARLDALPGGTRADKLRQALQPIEQTFDLAAYLATVKKSDFATEVIPLVRQTRLRLGLPNYTFQV